MMPARIVDAHHHLWDLRAVAYPWLMARGVRRFFGDPTPIQRDYGVPQFRADHEGLPVVASVHVQVGAADPLAESAWLGRMAAEQGFPHTIVAFADLTAPGLEAELDRHAALAGGRLRGIRQIVARHPDEDAAAGTVGLLDDPAFRAGLALLATRGLSFDLQLTAPLLEHAAAVLGEVPGLHPVLCHAGSPWDRSAEGLRAWRRGLAAMAALPLATAKLSGLGMFDPGWTRDSLAPIVEGVLDAFGPDRVMWGSNFPVDRLYRAYRPLLETVAAMVPERMHAAVFEGTATRVYRITP
jgi:predicted TIM-barrel fold metal-dependent hydrolase